METDQDLKSDSGNSPADFPAAHSMDSTWWAVDGHGHVARFDTGEAGAMPQDCANQEDFDLLESLSQTNFGGLTFQCDDLMAEPDGIFYRNDYPTPWNEVASKKLPARLELFTYGVLVWLKDEQSLTAFSPKARGEASLLGRVTRFFAPPAQPAVRPWVQRLPHPSKVIVWLMQDEGADALGKLIGELLASGQALRAWQYFRDLEPERFGFFAYSHETWDNWIAGPLERATPPPQAITVNQLPPLVAQAIARCALKQSDFSQDLLVQPFEQVQSYCWGDTWVSTAGHELRRDDADQGRSQLVTQAEIVQPASAQMTLTALLDAWLRGAAGADEVLNDYLQEASLPLVRDTGGVGRRLDEIMQTFFTPEELLLLEAEMLEHLPDQADSKAIRSVIASVRGFAAGQVAADDLKVIAHQAMQEWRDFDEEEGPAPHVNRAAWAAFALAMRWSLVAARTIRSLDPGQLNWQFAYVLQRLEQRYGETSNQ